MFEITEATLFYPDLPAALEGLRIVHVSDVHCFWLGRRERRLLEFLADSSADMLLCTGDVCYDFTLGNPIFRRRNLFENRPGGLGWRGYFSRPRVERGIDFYVKARDAFDGPMWAIQGNHDPDEFIAGVREAGIEVLENEARQVEIENKGRLNLLGLYCLTRFDADIPRALAGIEDGLFTIGLAHYPEMFEALAAGSVDLVLAGHTHGGQLCLPGGRPLITHSLIKGKYCRGLHKFGESYFYTNRGLGKSLIPLRTFCPAEVVELTLRRGDCGENILKTIKS